MFSLRTAISLVVAAGLSIGGMLAAPDHVRAKVRSSARTAVQAASQVVAELRAEANELTQTVELGAESRADVEAGAEGQAESYTPDLILGTQSEAQVEAETEGSLGLDGAFDLGSWIKLNLFGSVDG